MCNVHRPACWRAPALIGTRSWLSCPGRRRSPSSAVRGHSRLHLENTLSRARPGDCFTLLSRKLIGSGMWKAYVPGLKGLLSEWKCPGTRSDTPGFCWRGGGRTVRRSPRFIPTSCSAVSSLHPTFQAPRVDRMTSWLRSYGSVPLCVLLACMVWCAEASSTGEFGSLT